MEDRLQKFARLIDVGSFTKAARDMHISQPALSMSIHKLERELHTPLYVRGSQPLTLTPAGKQAYKSAKELDASLRTLRTRLSELAEQDITLSLGMIDSVADIVLANKRSMETLDSHAKTSLVINNSRYLLQALERGDIDMALIAEQSKPIEPSLASEALGAEPLSIVVHKDMAAKIAAEYARGEVHSFISYDQPSHTHAMIERFFAGHAVYVSPQFYSSSPDAIYHLVMAQKGAAALPYRKVRRDLRRGILVPFHHESSVIPRHISLVYRRNYQVPQLLSATMQSVRIDLAKLLTEAHTFTQ